MRIVTVLGVALLSFWSSACLDDSAGATSELTAAGSSARADKAPADDARDDRDDRDDRDRCRDIPQAPQLADWPRVHSAIRLDREQEAFIHRLVGAMTLEQKVGQMTLAEYNSFFDPATGTYDFSELTSFGVGAVLGGAGSFPNNDKHAAVTDWLGLADRIFDAAPVVTIRQHRRPVPIRIPALWGEDAVHGHGNVFGATLFPHNSGLGATRDRCLLEEIGEATMRAVRATGQDWTFGPCLAVARDDRWGRTYESWSEDPSIVRAFASSMTDGIMRVDHGRRSFRGILTSAKHYIGDGGSTMGIDQGVVEVEESVLRNIHGQGYFGALGSGAQTVMVGFFGTPEGKMSGNRHLVTEILKEKIGFDGFVVSDYNAIGQVAGCTNAHCPQAVNAGIDLFMVPWEWRTFIPNTVADVRAGTIPMSRIDDAVTRILRVKLRAGLFELPRPSERKLAGDEDAIVARRLARRAVRESLVLLKNDENVLPLRRNDKVLVVGKSADSIQSQTGGWSLSWQGGPAPFAPNDTNPNSDFPVGQSILSGIQETVGAHNVTFSPDASGVNVRDFDAVIAVIAEFPGSEVFFDIATATGNWRDPDNLALRTLEFGVRHPDDRAVVEAVSGKGVPVVTVLLAGRVQYTNFELNRSDAFIAAWLPGTEGKGIADVIFRKRNGSVNHDFSGKLPFSWPRSACQVPLNIGDPGYDPQFPFGYGLTYGAHVRVGALDETAGPAEGCTH